MLLAFCIFSASRPHVFELPTQRAVLNIIAKVNNHWQSKNNFRTSAFWHSAVYHVGNQAAYSVTSDEKYRTYAENWAEYNLWKGATSDDVSVWKYKNYGEDEDYVLFGDWQCCFQTYIDLYNLDSTKNATKIARAREVMEYQMNMSAVDFWWWADALFMVMPVMVKLHKVTANPQYLTRLVDYYKYAEDLMYDKDANLFYRDAKYIYPQHKTNNSKKDFWSRGNGWVFASLAKVISDIPADSRQRPVFLSRFRAMAPAIASCQQPEGYWARSLLDLPFAPGFETSGTALFTFGFLWGINNGILGRDRYAPIVQKAWDYLQNTALSDSGVVGYVQPIGERATQDLDVGPMTTADFGVGAFLLAASELTRYIAPHE
jgi:rhamnogalacturonyl hydrolase YesR